LSIGIRLNLILISLIAISHDLIGLLSFTQ
jgi:hypothetical protein